jgi:hypothetical protein
MKDTKSLPLSDTLRDLALLRVSDIDLSPLLSTTSSVEQGQSLSSSELDGDDRAAVNASVERSYEFVKAARSAVRMHHRGDVEKIGKTIDDVRSKIDDVLKGLEQKG